MTVESQTLAIVGLSVADAEEIMKNNVDEVEYDLLDWWDGEIYALQGELATLNNGYDTPAEYLGFEIGRGWDTIEVDGALYSTAEDLITLLNDHYQTNKFSLYIGVNTW